MDWWVGSIIRILIIAREGGKSAVREELQGGQPQCCHARYHNR